MKRILHYLLITTTVLLTVILLTLSIKGDKGDPLYFQQEKDTSVGGPFESSNSTARYALTEAIVENKTFELTDEQAKFSSPDLFYYNNKFYSIFTPGVSFVGVPFYMLGKYFNMPQLFTYLSVLVFALINFFLITLLARKLGAGLYAGFLGGFLFLFGTNALAYAHSYTQHHISTTIFLLSMLLAFGKTSVIKNIVIGMLFGAGLLVDIPNAILFVPIGLYLIAKHFNFEKSAKTTQLTIKLHLFAILIGLIPLLSLFAWYNFETTGSYLSTGQSIGRTKYEEVKKITAAPLISDTDSDIQSFPFNTRNQIKGFYTLLISDERSWFYYSPIVLLGIAGIFALYRKKETITFTNMVVGFITVNILLYAMFGDPWGGWAFGPRYLIPSAAALCVMLGVALHRYSKYLIFTLIYFIFSTYSFFISIVGALTTSAIPPKQEAVNLLSPIPYTYDYNLQFIEGHNLSSLVFNVFLKGTLEAFTYVFMVASFAVVIGFILYAKTTIDAKKELTI